jgi:hypothetical protein
MRMQALNARPVAEWPEPRGRAPAHGNDNALNFGRSAARQRQTLVCHWTLASTGRLECRWQSVADDNRPD